jgi:preprotein translocase subunit SecF
MLALGALMLLGGEVLFDFSLALLIGLVVGTYSSIFIASPLVLIWRKAAK